MFGNKILVKVVGKTHPALTFSTTRLLMCVSNLTEHGGGGTSVSLVSPTLRYGEEEAAPSIPAPTSLTASLTLKRQRLRSNHAPIQHPRDENGRQALGSKFDLLVLLVFT